MDVLATRALAATVTLGLVLLISPGCARRPARPVPPTPAPPPAADIYAAVIGRHFDPQPGHPLRILATLRAPPERLGSLDHPLWLVLMEASSVPMSVPDDLPAPLPYQLLLESEAGAPRTVPAWHDPLVSFSAVACDASESRALVWVEWHCGPECGGGGYYELERRGETWRTVNYIHRFDI